MTKMIVMIMIMMMMMMITLLDCPQPLYLAHAKGNVSEANAKYAGVWGVVCKRSEQEQIERL